MRIWKRGGVKNRGGIYQITYEDRRNGLCITRTVSSGVTDKGAAEAIGRQIKRLQEAQLAGEAPDAALLNWVDRTNATVQKHLAKYGLLDISRLACAEGILPLIKQYISVCRGEGQNAKFLITKETQLKKLAAITGTRGVRQLVAGDLRELMAQVMAAGRSARTANQHRTSAVGFLSWCEREGLVSANPFKHVRRRNEDEDRRLIRRAARPEELKRLLAAAPADRARIYLAFALTGLRRNELKQMTWADLNLADGTICVRAKVSKTASEATIPLHPQLATVLAAIKPQNATPTDRWFPSLPRPSTFYKDLKAAGIPKIDANGGKLDVHALRGTLGTNLARQGVPMPVVQRMLRHRSILTTARYYTHLEMEDLRQGVMEMPSIAPDGFDGTIQPMRDGLASPDLLEPAGAQAEPIQAQRKARRTNRHKGLNLTEPDHD